MVGLTPFCRDNSESAHAIYLRVLKVHIHIHIHMHIHIHIHIHIDHLPARAHGQSVLQRGSVEAWGSVEGEKGKEGWKRGSVEAWDGRVHFSTA